MTLLDRLRRPAREQPLLLGALVLAAAIAVIAVILPRSPSAPRQTAVATTLSAPAASPQGAVIGTRSAPAPSTAQVADSRRTARRFLASYLPVLYGRRTPSSVEDASPRVRAELRDAARSPQAPRNRHPRIARLTAHAEGRTTVVAIALIADSVTKPYQIALQLTEHDRRWQVTQLSNY